MKIKFYGALKVMKAGGSLFQKLKFEIKLNFNGALEVMRRGALFFWWALNGGCPPIRPLPFLNFISKIKGNL